jgi:hypothetical protein
VKESRTAYCKAAADIITYGLGVISRGIKELGAEFKAEMNNAGKRLLASLQTLATGNQDNVFQSFFFSLFNQQRCSKANKYLFIAYNFLVLYSHMEHGNLQSCNTITQHFAKVIFFVRAAITGGRPLFTV